MPRLTTLVETIVDTLSDKKARDIVVLNLAHTSPITDYFIIATGEINRHVQALADHLDETIAQKWDKLLLRKQGSEEKNWIVLDYGSVIVHLFTRAERQRFRLEELWSGKQKSNSTLTTSIKGT